MLKKVFFTGLTILSSFTSVNSLSCISMNNQGRKTRPQVANVDGDEPVFFPFSIRTSKCSGSCNNINHPYANICVPNNTIYFVFAHYSNNNTRYFVFNLYSFCVAVSLLGQSTILCSCWFELVKIYYVDFIFASSMFAILFHEWKISLNLGLFWKYLCILKL